MKPLPVILFLAAVAEQADIRWLARRFADYTIRLPAAPEERWRATWHNTGQMAMFENPAHNTIITSRYFKFPDDATLTEAVGDRDAYADVALRKYSETQFARNHDPAVRAQEIKIESRALGRNQFRYCAVIGHDRRGPRRGYFYALLRGGPGEPKFDGEVLILTITFPSNLDEAEAQRMLKTFDIMLEKVSFP